MPHGTLHRKSTTLTRASASDGARPSRGLDQRLWTVLEGQGQGAHRQGGWLGTSNCFSRTLKWARAFTRSAWSLAFTGDKPNSVLRVSLNANLISLCKVLADARGTREDRSHRSGVFTAGPSARRRKEEWARPRVPMEAIPWKLECSPSVTGSHLALALWGVSLLCGEPPRGLGQEWK